MAETEEFCRARIIGIDTTEKKQFTGDRTGHEEEILEAKKDPDEYAYPGTVREHDYR